MINEGAIDLTAEDMHIMVEKAEFTPILKPEWIDPRKLLL